jgi:hypothetical protein
MAPSLIAVLSCGAAVVLFGDQLAVDADQYRAELGQPGSVVGLQRIDRRTDPEQSGRGTAHGHRPSTRTGRERKHHHGRQQGPNHVPNPRRSSAASAAIVHVDDDLVQFAGLSTAYVRRIAHATAPPQGLPWPRLTIGSNSGTLDWVSPGS